MWNGLLNVYKEAGYTSNDVVARLRGILRQKKIGHTGTLDPAAVGVLPVLLGTACRLSEYLTDHDKTYRAVLRLGVTTDTQDLTGTVLNEAGQAQLEALSEREIAQAALFFQGGYDQVPPMYSAKQIGGKRLYDLAREGKVVERKPVHVDIPRIEIEKISLPLVTLKIDCSKGTYIRSICDDIGNALGCGAVMTALTRTASGFFRLEDAADIRDIVEMSDDEISGLVIPVDETLVNLGRVMLNDNRITVVEFLSSTNCLFTHSE